MEEDRRHLLAIIIAIMTGFGIATSAIPFLASLQPTDRNTCPSHDSC